MPRSRPRPRYLVASSLAALALLACAPSASAQVHPVIEAGRDGDIRALFAPHRWRQDVDGFQFETLQIRETEFRVGLERDGQRHDAVFRHHEQEGTRTPSFAVTIETSDPEGRAALETLIAAVQANDDGHFWRREAGAIPREVYRPTEAPWYGDGLFLFGLLVLWLLVLTLRSLEGHARRTLFLLALCTVSGGLLRWAIAPETFLGAWPYTRITHIQRILFEGPATFALSSHLGATWPRVEMARASGLFFAALTPVALFTHGRWLLGSARRGLLAAFIVAALPLHVRFSHSEVAFIPSIVLSCALFASAHLALRDTRRFFRFTALLACAPLAAAVMLARPLNLIFLPLFAVAVVWLCRDADRRMRAALVVVVSAASAAVTVIYFWSQYGEQVHSAAESNLLGEALALLVDPQRNTLISPYATPTGATLLALWAVKVRWRRERPRLLFLLIWLALFFVTHAYVVPQEPAMQARYHLHLLVPFVFLVAMGLERLVEVGRRPWTVLAFAYLGLACGLHYSFVTDVDFNDTQEHIFIAEARSRVEPGCSIIEYSTPGIGPRWGRVGEEIAAGHFSQRWISLPITVDDDEVTVANREALEDPPACLFFYEGLSCYGNKEPDQPIAPECDELRGQLTWEPVLSTEFESRLYDRNLSLGVEPGDPITLTLYRARR